MNTGASNFSFLQAGWPELFAEASRAEKAWAADPRAACFYARRTLELAVAWLFRAETGHGGGLRMPYKADLAAYLFEPSFKLLVGPALHTKMDVIRKQGNSAVHTARPVVGADAVAVLRELFHVGFWLARHYGRDAAARPAPGLQFRTDLLPQAAPDIAAQTQAALQKLAQDLAERDATLAAAQQKAAALDEELARLRAEVAAAKAANSALPDAHDYNEEQTRDLYIDLLLKEAGWALDQPRDREFEVAGMPNNQGRGFVDYLLWGDDGKPLALVEAKRTRKDSRVGQQQAKLYADCLQARFGQRPLIYYTNGYEHWFWDDAQYPPRAVQGFHKKDELQLLVQRRETRKPLAGLAIDAAIVERHYQQRAIRRIGEVFEQDRQRKALVVMATGAGKTRTVIALVDLLMRGNWVKRVLFLADRVALVTQAVNAFKAHLPDASPVNLVTDKYAHGRVYVSTYPTMMGLINESSDGRRRFGVGHFDLIVVDEAHRSIYQKYRAIFAYFDALLVGLTATPKDEIDRNTYGLFDLENGVPTDAYGLDDAIAEGYLVPPKAVSVPLKFQREGIQYAELSEDEKEQWEALDWDEEGGVPDEVNADAVNKWLFNTDTVDKVLATLMTRGHKVAGGDRLGKTIVFAKNNDHAEFIAERFNANYNIRLTEAGIRGDTAGLLHTVVLGMRMDNFVVRPQRKWVETWSVADAWNRLAPEQLQEISAHLSGLPTSVRDDDEDAKRFDLLVLRIQLCVLRAEPGFERLKNQVRDIADRLSELGSIPAVREQMLLIESVAGEEWWQDVSIPMLEQGRRHLRALVKLLDKTGRKVVYTNFEDELGEAAEVRLALPGNAGDFERFRTKARAFLREHEDHIALHRLRRNQPLTQADLAELERMLVQSGAGTAQDIDRAKQEAQGLGLFIRALVGLDRQAATDVLNTFLTDRTLSSNQIEFMNLVVNHLTERGFMNAALLYESPFTAFAPQGPDGLFTPAQVSELFEVLDHVKATAIAA